MKVKSNFCSKVIGRPICFLIVLGVSTFLFSRLFLMNKQSVESITAESRELEKASTLGIETTAKLLVPLNSSAMNFARALSSSLNGTELSTLDVIREKVAPTLFLALSTIPYISESSYIGQNGLLFSFYKDEDQIVAVFANASSSSSSYSFSSSNWFTQPVDRDSGELYGEAVAAHPTVTRNASWFQKALSSTNGYSWLGHTLNKAEESLFLSAVAMDGRGVISLGLPAKVVVQFFAALDFYGGFHLETKHGDVIIQSRLRETQIYVRNDTVLLQAVDPNGVPRGHAGNISCASDDGSSGPFYKKALGMKYVFYCSTLEIAGVDTVYVLALPTNGAVSLIQRNSKTSRLILLVLFVSMVISICVALFLIVRAAKREMSLCAAFIKQMDATQEAERKSMNKSQALAGASHDIRSSLAAITAWIELSHDCNTDSVMQANLSQMHACTKDLLMSLNTVLDTSRIEAGKMLLDEEEFNLAQLLEDVVDLFHPMAMKKGVDIVLDPCDGSITTSCIVRGDRGKLKRILSNLLNNAVKFTSEGHITVRATVQPVQETRMENPIINNASNFNFMLDCFCPVCSHNKKRLNDLDDLRTAQQAPNLTEFVIEVDDTGLGIPEDKRKSVFEHYNQVDISAFRQGGTGLGLGLVQSLVRLMGGDIRIVDKRPGERGTCFNINFKLPTYEAAESNEIKEETPRMQNPSNGFQSLALRQPGSPKPDGTHVILLIAGDQRRKLLMKYIESINISVSYVEQGKSLLPQLEKIKQKLDNSYFSYPEKTQMGLGDFLDKTPSFNSDSGPNDAPSGKSSSSIGLLLFVIDATACPFSELSSAIINFRKDLQNSRCKVVWLGHPTVPVAQSVDPPFDYILHRPLHGSRLYQVLGLIPELKEFNLPQFLDDNIASNGFNCGAQFEIGESSSHQSSLMQKHDDRSKDNRLNGTKVLVVEDHAALRMLAVGELRKLGANVDTCENGQEALDHICKLLSDQKKEGDSISLPYDYVFMDYEMPVMNGLEATRLIRAEEQKYGIHMPIIALTAHIEPELIRSMYNHGIDLHVSKLVNVAEVLEQIRCIDSKKR